MTARIRFLSDQIYETDGPGKGPKFTKGQVLDESDVAKVLGKSEVSAGYAASFLNRWVQRGVAVDADTPVDEVSDDDNTSDQQDDLSAMTRAQLDALAADRGVDVSQAKNKADVIDALQQAAS